MSGYEGRDPYDDYIKIKKELNDFDSKLLKKEQLIIANKMDMENSKENLIKFKNNLKEDIKIFEISAINEEGLDKVLLYMADLLDKEVVKDDFEDDLYEDYVLYTFKKENPFTIVKEKDCFVIKGDTVEKLFRMTKFNTEESILRFAKKLTRMGVDEELEKMGAVQGDKVRILDFEFEYRN